MSDRPEGRPRSKRGRSKRGPPRYLKFTREGRVFVLLTLGVGAAAVNTGNNLLYLVLGLLLSLIVLSGLLSESVLRRLRVSRRLPRRAFAATAMLVELAVRNDKRRLPSYSIELEDVAEGEATARTCYFLKVGAGEEQVAAYTRKPARRGPLAFTEVVVRTRYPFGLFEKSRRFAIEDELLVYPELLRPERRPAVEGATGPDVSIARRGPGAEVSGLRDYVAGDEARTIHWRRTASLGRMVVRERRLDAARRLTLVVDEARPVGADASWDAELERAIARAAATAGQVLEEGVGVEAVARSGSSPLVLPGHTPDPIWRFLALLEATPAESAPALPEPRGEAVRFGGAGSRDADPDAEVAS